ncbi:tyrosinase [Xylariales sp. PMI_506]|nr:tyrosinase [Xylariales sp. PMI_506]
MRFSILAELLALPMLTKAYVPASTAPTDELALESLTELKAAVLDGSLKNQLATESVSQTCTLENAAIRREYTALSNKEKLAYTNAVKCLMSKPAITPSDVVPGAKSRYDDFVATHVNQTLSIHGTGNFLSWHRYFVWIFEKALREECGYQGYVPYWNWGKSAFDPVNSPYLDGSKYSQGGNGVYEAHNCTEALPTGLNCIPPGVGGGCVETGPYVGFLANISATAPSLEIPELVPGPFLGYQPRCIRRDISPWVTSNWSTDAQSYDLLTNPLYQVGIGPFQDHLQGDFDIGFYGLHSAGHYTMGGDPGGDFFNSPNDPMFWLHHAQIDRTWWIWQNQQPVERAFAIAGTLTIGNVPPSANSTIEDSIDLGYNADGVAIKEVVSTVGGLLCYVYE